MEEVRFKFANKNSTLALGVSGFFGLEYPQLCGKIKKKVLLISDRLFCHIAVAENDIEKNPYVGARILFTNSALKKNMKDNQYVIPFLCNSRNHPLFRKRGRVEKNTNV